MKLIVTFDKSFASLSLQHVLPYLGVSDSGHAEDRYPTRQPYGSLSGTVTRQELDVMIRELEGAAGGEEDVLLASQALLALRLCGAVLAEEVPEARSLLASSVWAILVEKKVALTTGHYNALMRVQLENGKDFSPQQVRIDPIF